MTRDFLNSNWSTLSVPERGSNFQGWMSNSTSGGGMAKIAAMSFYTPTAPNDLLRISYGSSDEKPIIQVGIGETIFSETSPTNAISVGDDVLDASSSYYGAYNARKEEEKYRKKQMEKWLYKMWKEELKDRIKGFAEYGKYLKKKYGDFKS